MTARTQTGVRTRRSGWTLATGTVFLLVGLALAGGGVWLIARGGSWYYLVGGVVVAASGVLLLPTVNVLPAP